MSDIAAFKLINSETRELTRDLAREFNEMEASPTERELDPKRVQFLLEKAEAGLLVPFHWARVKIGNKWHRMNGQHSSNMLCQLNGSFPDGLKAHIDDFEVANPESSALLFRQFDPRQSTRGPKDVAGAYQRLYPELTVVPKPIGKLGIDGVAWFRKNVLKEPVGKGDDVYIAFNEKPLHPFLLWLGELFTSKTPEMMKPAVVGAMYATYDANAEEAATFWEQVARGGDSYDEEAATTVLDVWLRKAHEKEEGAERKPAELWQGCIHAWNGHRTGKKFKAIRHEYNDWLKAAE